MGENNHPVVILGYGAAAVSALFGLREGGYTGPITVVNKAAGAPYSPVLTSYYAAGIVPKDRCFPWSARELAQLDFALVENANVVALNAQARSVQLADGRTLLFSKCLIATGARPITPGFPETTRYAPLVLRTMDDAERLKAVLADCATREVLVSGTSMVALKALEACLCRGKRVTLLGRSDQILRGSTHPMVAHRCEKLLEGFGVELRLNDAVARADDACGAGIDIEFASDGATRHYDHVICAQGVAPNIGFVRPEEIAMNRGIVVDRMMRTSHPDVYAAGDVAEALNLSTGKLKVIGLWANAVAQGRVAGRAMAASLCEAAGSLGGSGSPASELPRKACKPFKGSVPCNTIHVASMLFASAGSVAEHEGVRIETEDRDGVFKLTAYRCGDSGARDLIGFNLLANVGGAVREDSLINETGILYRELVGHFL